MARYKKYPNKFKDYALYCDDTFIGIGSLNYLSKLIHQTPDSLRRYSTPVYLQKTKFSKWVLLKIVDDDAYIYFEKGIIPSDNTSLQCNFNLEDKNGKNN